jgi:hypothetical protein
LLTTGIDTIITSRDGLPKQYHPIAKIKNPVIAEKLMHNCFNYYLELFSLLDVDISDQDMYIISKFWAYLINEWDTKLVFSTAYH